VRKPITHLAASSEPRNHGPDDSQHGEKDEPERQSRHREVQHGYNLRALFRPSVGRLCVVPGCPRLIPAGVQACREHASPDGGVEAAGSGDGAAARRTVRLVVSGVDAVAARVA
jgi:hypothetical protein